MDEMSTAQDWDGWSNLNYAFHRRLHELSGKRHHVRLVTQVLNVVEPYSRIYVHMLSSSVRPSRSITPCSTPWPPATPIAFARSSRPPYAPRATA
jgi:DNA-binding GntR family transcriptional regulator